MLETKKVYNFKNEFCKELKIPMNQAERKLDELLKWLNEFFDYEFIVGKPNKIIINEIYGEYQPLPRKLPNQDKLNKEKIEKYTAFTIASLGTEYKPNSKMRVAREAIDSFGEKDFNHTNIKAVAKRYVKEPFDKYGETNNIKIWVYYSTYTPLENNILEDWRNILKEENIAETEAANAFYRQAEGEDISKELGYYQKAKNRFKEKYGDIPILVKNWKLKNEM